MKRRTEFRAATQDDIKEIARIHKQRFDTPEYTLGQFSVSLIGAFYRSLLGRCTFLVHVFDDQVDGFLVGGLQEEIYAAQRAFVSRHLVRCCLETMLHPRLWRAAYSFVRRSFLPQPAKFLPILAPNLPRVLSFAVGESAENTVAFSLLRAFESTIRGRYAGYTMSVLKTNRTALQFYERLGIQIIVNAFPRSFILHREFPPSRDDCPRQS